MLFVRFMFETLLVKILLVKVMYAERAGFEPAIPVARDTGFRNRRFQPLSHLSGVESVNFAVVNNCKSPWQRPIFPHLTVQYRQRYDVSLPCSGWERVVPSRSYHQGAF